MTAVTLHHVSKQYEQTTPDGVRVVSAIQDLSLKITPGDVLAVLGPSGCGKSTLLRLIAGLIEPDSGDILYDQTLLRDIPLPERGIGMVFQDGALMPHWEAGRTVGFHLWLRRRQQEVPARVQRISQITGFGLNELLGRRPRQLSGGEKQRVAIARALMRDPRVFLFDEPFSNLDAKLRVSARIELKRLLMEFPVTSVYVTHDQIEAVALAHRIAVMRAGMIEQLDTYQHLYSNPVNLFVATFVGTPTINLFKGEVHDHHWRGVNFGGYPIRPDLLERADVTLGVRPEHVVLAPEAVPAAVEARVESVTPFYSERFLLVECSAAGEHFAASLPTDVHAQAGDTLRLTLNPDGLLFFDTETGVRIG